jgi:hypothetical protein
MNIVLRDVETQCAWLRYDVGVEEPTPHRLTSRNGDLIVIRSKFTSASGASMAFDTRADKLRAVLQ